MKLLVALLICIAVFAAEAKKGRILNGFRVIDIRILPWNAAILLKPFTRGRNQTKDRYRCSASIIGRRKILTSGHCVCKYPSGKLKIRVGTTNAYAASPNNVYNAVWKFELPRFQLLKEPRRGCVRGNYIKQIDVAILVTDRDIQFNAKVKPIEVNFNRTRGVIPAFTMGYGKTEPDPRGRRRKAKGDLNYAKTKTWMCRNRYRGMLCASRRRNSIYVGDSGGPLVTVENRRFRQIGINQGGNGRDINYFVATHVMAAFIKPHINE